jgi:hypothetical protein
MYIISPDFLLYSADAIPELKVNPSWYVLPLIVVDTPLNPELIDNGVVPFIDEPYIVKFPPIAGLEVKFISLYPTDVVAKPTG